jgi:hypothetical protein
MKAIAIAFVKAKRAFGPALKDKNNPAFRSKYADLGACIEAVDSALLENGIALIQETSEDLTGVTIETVLLHESGEMIRGGKLHVPAAKQDPQGYGSALTYARRYSLMATCGIAPEDDDGNAAAQAMRQRGHALPEDEIAAMLAGIENAKTVADAKSATEAAHEIAAHDPAALARINVAVEAKRAAFVKARTKRETEVAA